MNLCFLGVETAWDIHKNKVMKANFNKLPGSFNVEKNILLVTGRSERKVLQIIFCSVWKV